MQLINSRTNRDVACHVELACTRATRRQGLLERDALDPSTVMILAPCFSIHTALMRFAIDVVFLDGDGVVCRVVPNLPPWRMALDLRARSVVELAGGMAESHDVRRGDRLYLSPGAGDNPSWSSLVPPSLRRMASTPESTLLHV